MKAKKHILKNHIVIMVMAHFVEPTNPIVLVSLKIYIVKY